MGFTSAIVLYLAYVDPVIVLVCADPLDPDDGFLEVDGNNQTVIVALDVEHVECASPPWQQHQNTELVAGFGEAAGEGFQGGDQILGGLKLR